MLTLTIKLIFIDMGKVDLNKEFEVLLNDLSVEADRNGLIYTMYGRATNKLRQIDRKSVV